MATKTHATGFAGPPRESPNGLSIKTRPALLEKPAHKENTGLRFDGADGASRTADALTSAAVDSAGVVVDFTGPTAQALDLHLLAPVDWRVLRAARLRALLDSPHAFTSSYARESGWCEAEWRQMFDAATWIVARETEKVIGLAQSVSDPKQPAARHMESVWVARTHRRRGVFRALLQAIADSERRKGATDLLLWVLEDNFDAQRVYEALGFEPTGERQFLPAVRRFERRLRLGIGHLKDS